MTAAADHKSLVATVQDLEKDLHTANAELRHLRGETRLLLAEKDRGHTRLKTLQTLSLAVFSGMSEDDIYQIAAQAVVQQVGYSASFVVRLVDGRLQVAAAYHATDGQIKSVREQLAHCQPFMDSYRDGNSFSTYHSKSAEMLALRAAFKHDEVIGHPIRNSERLLGFLVACEGHKAHSDGGVHAPLSASNEEVDFLASVASLLAYAVGQGAVLQSLEAQNAKLKQLDELKDSFLAVTSHQLRTPLSIVKWILSLLREDKDVQNLPEPFKMVAQAFDANERLIHVVNDLLNASRIHDGKLSHTPVQTNFGQFAEEILRAQSTVFEARGAELKSEVAEGLPYMGVDTILMREAIQNLIDNALDYNRVEKPEVTVSVREENGRVVLLVSNPGAQIPLDERSRIFMQFYRSPSAIRQRPNGNGLGLYLARAIVEAHGGALNLDSSTDAQTVFSITLPVHPKE